MVSGFPSPFCHVYFSFCFYLSLYIVSEFFWTCWKTVRLIGGCQTRFDRWVCSHLSRKVLTKIQSTVSRIEFVLNSFMPIRTHWISSVLKCKSKVLSVMEEPLDNAVTLFVAQCSLCSCRCYISPRHASRPVTSSHYNDNVNWEKITIQEYMTLTPCLFASLCG